MLTRFGLIALLVVTLAPAAAAQPAPSTEGVYEMGPGDVLDIIVWRNKELSMTVTVRPDGWISLPLLGDVRAAGVTPGALQKTLEQSFSKVVSSPMVTVVVSKVGSFKVSILGKVRQPGRYDLEGPVTVLDVLALAGGPNEYAQPDGMYVLRRSGVGDSPYQRIPARYSSSILAGKDNTNVTVKPGDIIIVP
jgi:polysaccharide export outer membrane protein